MQKKYLSLFVCLLMSASFILANQNEMKPSNSDEIIRLRVIGFSDLHGNFLTYDYLHRQPKTGGLPWIYSYVKQERENPNQHVILLNAGDILQGSKSAYYYNYIDLRPEYRPSVLLKKLGVDASVYGNHDLESGIRVVRRFGSTTRELGMEILSANVVYQISQRNVFKPYTILERGGLRIAILGLTTPILTGCARTQLLEGIDILDMFESAQHWVDHIQNTESPDLIIGLFHAGSMDEKNVDSISRECFDANDVANIMRNVPGFDGFILGHQHEIAVDSVHVAGKPVWFVEPGHGGKLVGVLDFEIQKTSGQNAKILNSSAKIVNVFETQKLSQTILDEFTDEEARVASSANQVIAIYKDNKPANSIEAFLGSNFFVDMVHKMQLSIDTAIDISFASPLFSHFALYPNDSIMFSDLLRTYRYQNRIMTIRMTGREIKDYLEYSYGLWINQMKSPNDDLLRWNRNETGNHFLFEEPAFNFDSGAGLDYEVDVTKPVGQRITITGMWKNKPFHEDSIYKVIINSYRTSGAGGHLELGAKITPKELNNRLIRLYDVQIQELLRRELIQEKEIYNFQYNNWKFVPDHYVLPAKEREFEELSRRIQQN